MTTATLTLTEFLLARIAEDEAAAADAQMMAKDPGPWWVDGPAKNSGKWWVYATGERFERPEIARHVARQDPTRVLAECEVKRKQIHHLIEFMEGDYAPWNEEQLEMMAEVYSDHPDYNEEWRA